VVCKVIIPRVANQRPFITLLILLVALSWLGLVVWGLSPHGRFMSHEAIDGDEGPSLACARTAAFFVAAWVLMTVAMMLPTALPLVMLFRRLTSSRPSSGLIAAMLMCGYLLTWVLFGAVAHIGDLGLHMAIDQSHWLADYPWIVGASVFVVAGGYQFTPLKYFCLDKCRSPYSFIISRWHGQSPRLNALALGVHHGIFCIGCCWSLMLLMFAVGVGNIAWMLVLGSVMAVEKNLPWGRRLSTPLGLVLVTIGLTIFAVGLTLDPACAHDGRSC
jgi:predicted metal-binding membrane protein